MERQQLEKYFETMLEKEPVAGRQEKLLWRLSCFDSGRTFVDFIERHYFGVQGRRVLDVGGGWGGHAIAFATSGGSVIAADLDDFQFPSLQRVCRAHETDVNVLRANCEELPFPPASFDIIIALELIEHIKSVDRFASEVTRLLKPDGVCIVSTPARFRSLLDGEPHYHLKGLTLLPFAWQGFVARKFFGRGYPFPITRQYATANAVIRPFRERGLSGRAVLTGRVAERLPSRWARRLAACLFWSFIVITRPNQPARPANQILLNVQA